MNLNPCPSEEQEQKAVFSWAEWMSNRIPELQLLFHIPNGGLRSKTEAKRFKAAGVKPGVLDLMLPVARSGYHGLFIEMKRKCGGRLSADQKEWIRKLDEQGYQAVTAHGCEEACDYIEQYFRLDYGCNKLIEYMQIRNFVEKLSVGQWPKDLAIAMLKKICLQFGKNFIEEFLRKEEI